MRLIDTEAAKKFFRENLILPDEGHEKIVETMIDAVPTAYDIDKVVDELNKASWEETDISTVVYIDEAIEIVKQGGVADDCCEWNSVSDGEFIKNPHTNRLYSNEPSMKNIYCNCCGKKIKVVE